MKLRSTAIAVAFLGVVVSGYALKQHYAPAGTSFCNLSNTFSCDLVNQGPWSEIAGIPVALLGVFAYGFLAAIAIGRPHGWERWFFLTALGGLAFSLYLTYLEAFVIHAWCIVCLASFMLIGISTAIGHLLMRKREV